jgi:hypothetical protein
MGDWASAFSNFGSKLFDGNNIGNIGSLMGGAGSLYGAYNANKLGNAQIDLAKEQNQLYMDKYNQDKKDKESQNNSFASVWG